MPSTPRLASGRYLHRQRDLDLFPKISYEFLARRDGLRPGKAIICYIIPGFSVSALSLWYRVLACCESVSVWPIPSADVRLGSIQRESKIECIYRFLCRWITSRQLLPNSLLQILSTSVTISSLTSFYSAPSKEPCLCLLRVVISKRCPAHKPRCRLSA